MIAVEVTFKFDYNGTEVMNGGMGMLDTGCSHTGAPNLHRRLTNLGTNHHLELPFNKTSVSVKTANGNYNAQLLELPRGEDILTLQSGNEEPVTMKSVMVECKKKPRSGGIKAHSPSGKAPLIRCLL